MNKFILVALGIIVVAAAATAGMFSLQLKNKDLQQVTGKPQCVDFDSPSVTDTVTYGGATYGLIKSAISIAQSKMNEMELIGTDLYRMTSVNWYGQQVTDVVYKRIATPVSAGTNNTDTWFDVYFKTGMAIPNYIKNCQSSGGTIAVVQDETTFPPYGFNKTEISGPGANDPSIKVAYIYNGNLAPASTIKSSTTIGTLFVKSKNKPYELKLHLGTIYLIDGQKAYEYMATETPISPVPNGDKSLQLKKVQFVTTGSVSWYTPNCKPAIYLYPEKTQNVKVKVSTRGEFTLTIPQYPLNGWDVIANPDGTVESGGKEYPYLYYESKIPDQLVKKPKNGYVVDRVGLQGLFDKLLPQLGLKNNEETEFKDYWLKVLPESPYYFVGVMKEQDISSMEPLEISPSPKTLIRVRLYFEMLDKRVNVSAPEIKAPKRDGFTVVEWGGMVKTDKNSQFTCSQ